MDAEGNIVPMKTEDLAAALVIRDEHLDRVRDSRSLWSRATIGWTTTLDQFGLVNVETLETQEDIHKAEQETDAAFRSALQMLGSVAVGLIGAGL